MTKKTKTAAETKAVEVKESTVYIAKSLLGLPQYTIFKGGVLPPHIEKMCEEKPAIRGLVVPVSQLQEARKNIRKKGHILNYYAQELEKQLNKKEA